MRRHTGRTRGMPAAGLMVIDFCQDAGKEPAVIEFGAFAFDMGQLALRSASVFDRPARAASNRNNLEIERNTGERC